MHHKLMKLHPWRFEASGCLWLKLSIVGLFSVVFQSLAYQMWSFLFRIFKITNGLSLRRFRRVCIWNLLHVLFGGQRGVQSRDWASEHKMGTSSKAHGIGTSPYGFASTWLNIYLHKAYQMLLIRTSLVATMAANERVYMWGCVLRVHGWFELHEVRIAGPDPQPMSGSDRSDHKYGQRNSQDKQPIPYIDLMMMCIIISF